MFVIEYKIETPIEKQMEKFLAYAERVATELRYDIAMEILKENDDT